MDIPYKDTRNFEKGTEFERYVEKMFPETDFEFLFKSDTVGTKVPDFYVRDKHKKYKFWVEAKWRSKPTEDDKINIFEDKKDRLNVLLVFQGLVMPERVFLILGLGGTPTSPEKLYCLPVLRLEYPSPYLSTLEDFKHGNNCEFTFEPYHSNLTWAIRKQV
jgi:hypothetical protein